MDEYKVLRVETDTKDVASVVVACCKQDQKFYAEYLVLIPHLKGFRSWHYIEEIAEDRAKKIIDHAWEIAKQKMMSEELRGIFRNQHADGDDSDFDGFFKPQYPTEMGKLHDEVKCPCLRDLLNNKKMR